MSEITFNDKPAPTMRPCPECGGTQWYDNMWDLFIRDYVMCRQCWEEYPKKEVTIL